MKGSKLDSLLHDWAARHAGDPAQRETLAEGIRQQLARQPVGPAPPAEARTEPAAAEGGMATSSWPCPSHAHEDVGMAPVPHPALRKRLSGGMVYAVCGFAAGLLVAIGLFLTSRGWREPIVPDSTAETALLSASEIKRSGELFRRMEEVFPGDLRWIAETNGEVSLGLGHVSGATVSRAAPLLVRTVVLERKRGESSWQRVFTADVLSRSEELVEVSPSQEPAGRLVVWAYRLPDGNVAVDANLRLTESPAASVNLTNVLAPGRAAQVLTTCTADAEFRVFQAASPLSS